MYIELSHFIVQCKLTQHYNQLYFNKRKKIKVRNSLFTICIFSFHNFEKSYIPRLCLFKQNILKKL